MLLQLGSPASLKTSDVRSYLKDFLGDPRVVDLPAWWWKIILYTAVLPFRPSQSARAYARIWQGDGFPLPKITGDFAREVQAHLPGVDVEHAFLLGRPNIQDVWDTWEKRGPVEKVLVIPLFPQYCEGTVASAMDAFLHQLKKRVNIPRFEFLASFHRARAFIDNSVDNIHRHLQNHPAEALVVSFHGIPVRRILSKGDLYYRHCWETFCLLQEGLRQRGHTEDIHFTFQSRFGSEEWLGPYTDRFCCHLAAQGVRRIAVTCPSFVADCLETTDEIGHELAHEVKNLGAEISLIPCLNTDSRWCKDFAELARRHLKEGRDQQHQLYHQQEFPPMPEQKLSSPPLSPETKSTLKMVFATLFLDLVGFSIIFPLFPALAKYYLEVDGDNPFLRLIFDGISRWAFAGGGGISNVVLFGSALGALYSLLQFVAAPLWGTLSDKIGRRPVLITSLVGLSLSYALWFFSGSFTLLIFARFVGGIMAGNISTATAVVGDVTERQNRSKGMAIIGVAFALGFILGPALGGIASLIDLSTLFPEWRSWGVNPFSLPALLAFVLSAVNLAWVIRCFPETLPPKRRGQKSNQRSANLWKLFRPLPLARFQPHQPGALSLFARLFGHGIYPHLFGGGTPFLFGPGQRLYVHLHRSFNRARPGGVCAPQGRLGGRKKDGPTGAGATDSRTARHRLGLFVPASVRGAVLSLCWQRHGHSLPNHFNFALCAGGKSGARFGHFPQPGGAGAGDRAAGGGPSLLALGRGLPLPFRCCIPADSHRHGGVPAAAKRVGVKNLPFVILNLLLVRPAVKIDDAGSLSVISHGETCQQCGRGAIMAFKSLTF